MLAKIPSTLPENWPQKAKQFLIQEDYFQAVKLYELAIETEPENKSHYWNLGLLLLLQGQEAEAQTTWLLGMADGEGDLLELWTQELLEVLQQEADRRGNLKDYSVAWAIRQHIREINPTDIHNLLHLVGLSILLKMYTGEELFSLGVLEMLQSEPLMAVDFDLLMQVLQSVLEYAPFEPSSLEFAEACIPHVREEPIFLKVLIVAARQISHSSCVLAAQLASLGLRLNLDHLEPLIRLSFLHPLASYYQDAKQYDKGIEIAKLCCTIAEELADQLLANYKLLRGLMGAVGYWEEVGEVTERQQSQIESLILEQPTNLHSYRVVCLFATTFFFPYYQDQAKTNRYIHNQVAQICQKNVEIYAKDKLERYRERNLLIKTSDDPRKRPLKIGYLSHCFGRHSVGWLARWLFHYHNRDRFKIHTYFIAYRESAIYDPLEAWYIEHSDKAYKGGFSGLEVAEQIYEDEIDILIDLDSITLDISCDLLSLKPAPIQITWLGWDASGLPAIDYFIADPYVLPEGAEEYYSEKIWRLPQTYIAVDGFEVEIPTVRRENLNIESDAVIYLSSQVGYKRHPHTVRLQFQILAQVPNSYFLIKGGANDDVMRNFFYQIAEEEGVDRSRLRFLPQDFTEGTHRANLMIADVVLDTYPYNGATTTLETLWMCIPLVTKVGQQFAARNSYTMMMNVGVTEGIAWTDEEYIEWGVRLGKDESLREKVAWKLRQSRQTSPLWNGKQFAQEMESAYEQMWEIFLNS
jgi:predicted O-linked N-acetylglucosamine transferase (SPINDLY family)